MTNLPVYLDYAATTPVDAQVADAMMQCLTMDGNFGNPASRSHIYGWKSEEAVEIARQQVAKLIGADARDLLHGPKINFLHSQLQTDKVEEI